MAKKSDGFGGLKCVECGEKATEGSMKHPYCKKCFKAVWNDEYEKYSEWLATKHGVVDFTRRNKIDAGIILMPLGVIVILLGVQMLGALAPCCGTPVIIVGLFLAIMGVALVVEVIKDGRRS